MGQLALFHNKQLYRSNSGRSQTHSSHNQTTHVGRTVRAIKLLYSYQRRRRRRRSYTKRAMNAAEVNCGHGGQAAVITSLRAWPQHINNNLNRQLTVKQFRTVQTCSTIRSIQHRTAFTMRWRRLTAKFNYAVPCEAITDTVITAIFFEYEHSSTTHNRLQSMNNAVRSVCLRRQRFCDPDLWTHDLENVISSSP